MRSSDGRCGLHRKEQVLDLTKTFRKKKPFFYPAADTFEYTANLEVRLLKDRVTVSTQFALVPQYFVRSTWDIIR